MVLAGSDGGYSAAFPDFPECSVASTTLDDVIKKAREALLMHIENLLEAGCIIDGPTDMEAIQRGHNGLLAAIEVPDDLQTRQVDIAIPALAMTRIESFADRHGLSLAALFVRAVDRWATEEAAPRESAVGMSDGPTLFDFGSPPELRVEALAEEIGRRQHSQASDPSDEVDSGGQPDAITAELARLLGDPSEVGPAGLTDYPVADEAESSTSAFRRSPEIP
ncbi:type II toxin-antitoxin system HicB family antitoxin [Bradyrhizobium sp. TZ2]